MATYSYKVYKKQVSYDGGATWYDVDPLETIKMVTGWNVECSGLTYAARVTEANSCNSNLGVYEWFIAEKKDKVEREDVIKIWGGAGAGTARVGHASTSENNAVRDCDEVFPKTLHIMPTCTEIGNRAFDTYQHFVNTFGEEYKIAEMSYLVFDGISSLRKIGSRAFYGSDLVGKIELPDTLQEIGSLAFADTSYLTHVNIGSGITTICDDAFWMSNDSYLSTPKVITINKATPPTLSGNSYSLGYNTIIVPTNSVDAYRSAWTDWTSPIMSNITSSANTSYSYEYGAKYSAVGYTDNLTAVTTSNVTRNANTNWVKFGNSVVEIGNSLFQSHNGTTYKNLNYVIFGNSLKKIGANAFDGIRLFDLEFPNSLEEIGDEAFSKVGISGVHALHMTKLKFGSGLKKIGNRAFWWNQIERLELPNSLEEIGDYAFNSCHCKEIVWSSNLKKIGTEAFGGTFERENTYATGCTEFDIVIPEGVEEVGSYLFGGGVNDGCDSLINSITFPTTLTKIGNLTQYCRYSQDSTLIFLSTTPPQVTSGEMASNVQIYVPCESLSLYRNTSPFNLYPSNIHPIEQDCPDLQKRWVSFGYKDINGQLYPNEIEQASYDGGATWNNTGQERQGSTSVGSSSYSAASVVVRSSYMTGLTNTIQSLGVTMKYNTEIYLNDTYYNSSFGGTNGYLIGDGEGNAIITLRGSSSTKFGYYYDLGGNRATASTIQGTTDRRFGNYYIKYKSGDRDIYWVRETALSTIETSTNLGLFSGDVAGGIISLRIFEGETLVRDFVPRYLSSLNTATLYDNVSNTYCEVNGTLAAVY